MGLSKGWYRLCTFATAVWLTFVIAFALYEYMNQNMFCEFGVEDVAGSVGQACRHVFWEWLPEQLAKTWAFTLAHSNNVADRPHAFVPKIPVLSFVAFGPPAALWVLASGVAWVVTGFRKRS